MRQTVERRTDGPRGFPSRAPGKDTTLVISTLGASVGDSVWELVAIVFVVTMPLVPVTYLAWSFLGSRRTSELESGRSSATPSAAISVVATAIAAAAVLVLLLVIGVRALAA